MGLYDAIIKLKYDTRLIDYHVKHDILKKEELNAHLGKLEDCSHNAVQMEITADKNESNQLLS